MDAPPVDYTGVPSVIPLRDGVELRAFTPDDLDQSVETINANLDHLRAWMPWAAAPATPASQRDFLERSAAARRDGTGFTFGIYDGGRLLGGIGVEARGAPGVLEIGYWLAADAQGRGLVTEAARALTRAAAAVPVVERIEICCDVANTRSAAVPARLGFRHVATEDREPTAAAETGRHMRWAIDADDVRRWPPE